MWILDLCIRALGCRQNTLAASGGAGTFANSRVQNFSSPANKRDANSCGTSANYRSLFILNYYNVHIYIWYMHVFVHVYAMIITIEICFYIFIHNQDCPHMSCFLVECKCQCVFFVFGSNLCSKCFFTYGYIIHEISSRLLRCSSPRFFAVLSWCRGCCNGRLVTCQLRYCRRYVSTRGAASRHCHDGCSLADFFVSPENISDSEEMVW